MESYIISEHYWPSNIIQDTDTKSISFDSSSSDHIPIYYHPDIKQLVRQYSVAYTVLKKPRRLHPLPMAGRVELQLDFEDGSLRNFVVTPIQVSNRALVVYIIYNIYIANMCTILL